MNKKILMLAVATAAALTPSALGGELMGKCYGVSKEGENDCSDKNNIHSCGGQSPKDYDPNEYVRMSKTDCEKDPHHTDWIQLKDQP